MKVSLKNHWVVKPAEPTWNGTVSLSEFDQTFTLTHVPTIYYYKFSTDFVKSTDDIIKTLKTSLSKALVYFYPLAGRLRWISGSRLELKCDASGVVLTKAESDAKLDDLDDLLISPDYNSLFPHVDYTIPIDELPLLFVQLTEFQCGAIALSFAISHAVVDGQSALYFFSQWARIARGESLIFDPFHDRKVLRAGEPATASPTFEHLQFNPAPVLIDKPVIENKKKNETRGSMLKLTKVQVEKLREKANQGRNLEDSKERSYTRYEIVTAHIWRCACKARDHKFEQPTNLSICVDIRKKMRPPLPKFYFGNAIVDVIATGVSGDIASSQLEYVARKVRVAIEMVTNDYANSTINFLKSQEDLSKYQDIHSFKRKEDPSYGNPNLGVISWISLPLLGLDFGWGKEIHMSPGIHEYDGDCVVLPGNEEDGSLTVAIVLQNAHMDAFKKFFYEDIES
ncbi:hypothetical protein HAX54_027714 [Datura stramonium]|uniref:Spermidine hydroxycinnamoyl transferase n=1 Tax=Datura stramonium TaxID=4076 RepID=A0ABS8V544_DATST|nr:hypothetical protein [Datura stramonium]